MHDVQHLRKKFPDTQGSWGIGSNFTVVEIIVCDSVTGDQCTAWDGGGGVSIVSRHSGGAAEALPDDGHWSDLQLSNGTRDLPSNPKYIMEQEGFYSRVVYRIYHGQTTGAGSPLITLPV